jgi:hypothetical protein
MLFDLRARGRRRTVQVVYVGLALLFLVGFVGFGVGVGGGGGSSPIEAFFGNKEGTKGAGFAAQVSAAEKRTRKTPDEAAAWVALTEAQFHESGAGEYFDEATQKFTGKGKALLAKVASSWSRYVALNPAKLDQKVAQEMLTVYSREGLNEPTAGVEVLQLLIPTKAPSASLYGQLASFAYEAKNTRVGDLASQKAVALAPVAQRAKVKAELEHIKNNPTGSLANETYTTTTNGKTYHLKLGPNGTATGTVATSTTPLPPKKK